MKSKKIELQDVILEEVKESKAKKVAIHIRRNKLTGHPAVIVGEDGQVYLFLTITSHPIKGAVQLERNPNQKVLNPSYIVFRLRANKKGAFSASLNNWSLTPRDYRMIQAYVSKKLK